MTCIVGIAHKGQVILGADSAGADGWLNRRIRTDRKIFINSGIVFGFTTSFRMGQLLQHELTPPPVLEGQEPYQYAVKQLVPAIRTTLRAGGWLKNKDGREEGGTFLVGFRGHLFSIHDDLQVGESTACFEAVGCGDAYAMGAMHAASHLPPKDRLLAGLEAAASFSAGVAGPFHFIATGSPE